MALRQGRIGSIPDAIQYDDGDYDTAIEVEDPIRQNAAPVNVNDVLRLTDLPTIASLVTAGANIDDHAVVRGDGGARGIQGSGVTIDDNDNINIPTGQGYQVDGTQVVTDQQAAEADAAAITAIAAAAGADTIDLAAFNIDLGTLVTEIGAIRTTLNNLLAKLRTHGLIDT